MSFNVPGMVQVPDNGFLRKKRIERSGTEDKPNCRACEILGCPPLCFCYCHSEEEEEFE